MNKKIKLVLPTIVSVVVLSLLMALSCTYLMKEKKVKEFKYETKRKYQDIIGNIGLNFDPRKSESDKHLYEFDLEQVVDSSTSLWELKEDNYNFAAVLYDYYTERTVINDSRLVMLQLDRGVSTIHLSDYLTKEELISMSQRVSKTNYLNDRTYYAWLDENKELVVLAKTPSDRPENWIFHNESKKGKEWISVLLVFPEGMQRKAWAQRYKDWQNDNVLQAELEKAKSRIKEMKSKEYETDTLLVYDRNVYKQILNNDRLKTENTANLIAIATYHPWKAAMEDLAGAYLFILLFAALISFLLSKNILDTYKKQKDLDDTRNAFVASMAHDLKTPLSVIKGYSENLMENDDKKKKEDFLNKIINQTDELNGMVSDMLDISKMDSSGFEIERKEIVLNDILKKAIDNYSQAAEERSLSFHPSEKDSFKMVGDENLLEKLFSNLIDNAVSYGKEGSEIAIDIDQDKISIYNKADPIKEEKLKNIFEVKSGSNGHHGFGLYFAKKVADIHGLQLSIGNVNKGVRTVLSIDKYQTKYKRILLAKKLGVIPVFTSILLYMLSIYMDAHFDMQIVRTIRHFSFNVLLITILGIIYLYLFTRNLKVNYEYCRIDPTSFNTNAKYASFGIALMALMFFVSVVWIITLFVQVF